MKNTTISYMLGLFIGVIIGFFNSNLDRLFMIFLGLILLGIIDSLLDNRSKLIEKNNNENKRTTTKESER